MKKKLLLKISAIVSGISGLIILAGVIIPIISYQGNFGVKYSQLLSPIVKQNPILGASDVYDSTKASTWFKGGALPEQFVSANVFYYTISIPKLRIENATVAIGGEDLAKHLIQYPGTALPGKRGNAVIFGHSILPVFYNPKTYLAIFSLLPTLKPGDEIDVTYDGVGFRYRVENLFEVGPTDIQVLEQDSSDSFLTLVTCVPPGDPRMLKRLIVRARVIPPEESNANLGN